MIAFFKRIFTLKLPDKVVSEDGKLIITKYGTVRSNSNIIGKKRG